MTHLQNITTLIGAANVFSDEATLQHYSHDETEDLRFLPEMVVKPENAEQISKVLRYCNEHSIPVTPRAGGTGLSGGALPIQGGVLLSVEKLNKILDIDLQNLQATVETGVITQVLMDEAAKYDLYYPVDPSSKGSCMLGGNIAHGSGGPRVIKYGTIREYILNLEVVLPTGEIIWTGANTLKYASGYNITQLMIGSEGTLGIITKAVVKLLPAPKADLLLMASFPSAEQACAAVSAIFRAGIVPSALEFMERDAVVWVVSHEDINFDIDDATAAYLLIEVDGADAESLFKDCELITEVLYKYECGDVLFADTAAQKEQFWRIRRNIAHSVKAHSVYKEEDTVVPRAALPSLLRGLKELGKSYGFRSICYGHAGDGNLHINIVKGEMDTEKWENELPKAIRQLFELTVRLGGTISGEHGIGLVQKSYMDIKYSAIHLDLMRGVKKVFDPKGILNPGKIF